MGTKSLARSPCPKMLVFRTAYPLRASVEALSLLQNYLQAMDCVRVLRCLIGILQR
jgi:hypothetical protein